MASENSAKFQRMIDSRPFGQSIFFSGGVGPSSSTYHRQPRVLRSVAAQKLKKEDYVKRKRNTEFESNLEKVCQGLESMSTTSADEISAAKRKRMFRASDPTTISLDMKPPRRYPTPPISELLKTEAIAAAVELPDSGSDEDDFANNRFSRYAASRKENMDTKHVNSTSDSPTVYPVVKVSGSSPPRTPKLTSCVNLPKVIPLPYTPPVSDPSRALVLYQEPRFKSERITDHEGVKSSAKVVYSSPGLTIELLNDDDDEGLDDDVKLTKQREEAIDGDDDDDKEGDLDEGETRLNDDDDDEELAASLDSGTCLN